MAPARRRAAACPYLLLDAGFADPRALARPAAAQVGEPARAGYARLLHRAGTAALVTQAVFIFAWHLARCQGSAARLLLGMPAPCVELLAQRTLAAGARPRRRRTRSGCGRAGWGSRGVA